MENLFATVKVGIKLFLHFFIFFENISIETLNFNSFQIFFFTQTV